MSTPHRAVAIVATTALWALWGLCVALILPVLLSVPGRPDFWELALYMAVMCAVVSYPVALPVLLFNRRRARQSGDLRYAKALGRTLRVASGGVVLVLSTLCLVFYLHERARPVLTQEAHFENAFSNAILRQDTGWMERLIAEGASVDHPMSQGQTPAILSAEFGNWSLVVFLLGKGADPDRKDLAGQSVRTIAIAPRRVLADPAEARSLERVKALLNVE